MWVNILVNIAVLVVASILAPKPEDAKASSIEDFDIPVTKEGQEIGKIYGTPWIAASQVVWYGDLKKIAIKDKGGKK